MPRIMVAYDGDNVTRTLANGHRRLDYAVMSRLISSWFGRAEVESHLFHSTTTAGTIDDHEDFFAAISELGIHVHYWNDGFGGYPDQFVTDWVRKQWERFDVLIVGTSDRSLRKKFGRKDKRKHRTIIGDSDYVTLVREARGHNKRGLIFSPLTMRWPIDIEAHCFDALASQTTGLLKPMRQAEPRPA